MRIQSVIPFQGGDAFVSSLCKHMAQRVGSDSDDILRTSSPSLIPAGLVDRLKILSPRTWWAMVDFESKRGSSSSFDMSTMTQSALGLLLPVLVLCLLRLAMICKNQCSSRNLSRKTLLAILLSPWSLQCLHQFHYQVSIAVKSFRSMVNMPSSTLTRATDALKLRIQHGRAYRTHRYDVYLPTNIGNNEQEALLFLPGASVGHEAYSEVAARLSDEGFVVAVMSLEPFRLASPYLGTNRSSVKRIFQQVTREICGHVFEDNLQSATKTIEWTLMGHSMGAFGAMKLFRTFMDDPWADTQTVSPPNTATIDIIVGNKLVLWGVAAFVDFATDISDLDAKLLILQGTHDEIVYMKRCRQVELEALFPPSTTIDYICGGTHEGFGSYEPSFHVDNGRKLRRPASLDQQHKRVCDETVKFLRSPELAK